MVGKTSARWVLAFNASCGRCRDISRAVAQASAGRLEVMPLTHPEVRRWREQSLGSGAAWAPTLIRTEAGGVRSWTPGPAMVLALVRRLGPRSTIRALKVLGRQRNTLRRRNTEQTGGSGQERISLQLVFGLLAAVMMMKPPESGGEQGGSEDPYSWVEANRDHLPQAYDDFAGHSMAYRRAIYTELSPAARSQLWVDQLNRYRNAHPQLSADQITVIDQAVEVLSRESTFSREAAGGSELDQAIEQHRESAIAAFGRDEAADLFARLGGPVDDSVMRGKGDCVCHHRDDAFCPTGQVCQETDACRFRSDGCGWWWSQPCDGLCFE